MGTRNCISGFLSFQAVPFFLVQVMHMIEINFYDVGMAASE
jgi:hypothetical protein